MAPGVIRMTLKSMEKYISALIRDLVKNYKPSDRLIFIRKGKLKNRMKKGKSIRWKFKIWNKNI